MPQSLSLRTAPSPRWTEIEVQPEPGGAWQRVFRMATAEGGRLEVSLDWKAVRVSVYPDIEPDGPAYQQTFFSHGPASSRGNGRGDWIGPLQHHFRELPPEIQRRLAIYYDFSSATAQQSPIRPLRPSSPILSGGWEAAPAQAGWERALCLKTEGARLEVSLSRARLLIAAERRESESRFYIYADGRTYERSGAGDAIYPLRRHLTDLPPEIKNRISPYYGISRTALR